MKKLLYLLLLVWALPPLSVAQKTEKIKFRSPGKDVKRDYYAYDANPELKHGSFVEYYRNKKTMEGKYLNNQRDGEWLFYTRKEILEIKGQYKNGDKNGKWVHFYSGTDIIQTVSYYSHKNKDSLISYYKNGNIKRLNKYSKDLTIRKTFYENGQLYEVIRTDAINGEVKLYFQNGQLHREIIYYKSQALTVINCFNQNGENIDGGSLKNGTGEFILYDLPLIKSQDKLQLLSYQNYRDTVLNGLSRLVNEHGHTVERGEYIDGEKAGLWEYFDLYGEFKDERYFHPKNELSSWTSNYYIDYSNKNISQPFFPGNDYYDVKKIARGEFINNKRNGEWSFFSKNGILQFIGTYINGEKDGKWLFYHENTKGIATEIYYSKNKMDSAFKYFKKGQLQYELKNFPDRSGSINSYYENGTPREIIKLKENLIDGLAQIYFSDGQLHRTTIYAESTPKTVLKCYNQKGVEIYGGLLHDGNGDVVSYYIPNKRTKDTLVVKSIEHYKNNFLDGEALYIRNSGKAQRKGFYSKGKKRGTWMSYGKSGKISRTTEYYNEKLNPKNQEWIYSFLEDVTMPLFPDGEEKMYRFIGGNIVYPIEAKRKGISGRVFVEFLVQATGEVTDIRILSGIGGGCDEEVIKVIKMMPKWTPGIQEGVPAKVAYRIPIKFTLQ